MVAEREKLCRTLAANPEIRRIVAKALEVEQAGAENTYYLGGNGTRFHHQRHSRCRCQGKDRSWLVNLLGPARLC